MGVQTQRPAHSHVLTDTHTETGSHMLAVRIQPWSMVLGTLAEVKGLAYEAPAMCSAPL